MWMLPLLACAASGVYEYRDAFNYPDGTAGEPAWTADSINWEVRAQGLMAEGPIREFAWPAAAPPGKEITTEVTLVVESRKGAEWATAGLAVRLDAGNYWHLALVEAPEANGRRHFVELQEMLDGQWLSAGTPPTSLTATVFEGSDYPWEYKRPYRLRIVMTSAGIEGTVSTPDGKVCSRLGYTFDKKAVAAGRPALDNGGFISRFDDFVARVDQTVPEPATPRKTTKPYNLPGFDGVRQKPTGFFHVKQIDGTWWLIDPNGRGFYVVGTDHISYQVHWCEKLGHAPYHRAMQAKYGNEAAWADVVAGQLKSWGFNTLPGNHSPLLRYRDFAHILWLGWGCDFAAIDDIVPRTTWTGIPNVFSPKWARYCERRAREQCLPDRDDPWVLGYFIDNELEWFGKNYTPWGVFAEAWKKPGAHSAKQAWLDLVRKNVGSVQAFNTQWGTNIASFDELRDHTSPGAPRNEDALKLAGDFLKLVADRYFQVAAQAIRKVDPHHMVLGCRFAGDAPEIWDVAGRYCDIVSLNTYPLIDVDRGIPQSLVDFLTERHRKCGRPMMITEWSFPALDAGLPSKHGAGMRVDTQAQRARCFEHYQTLLFSLPFMVGSDYFMWVDEPAEGISKTFPEDSNYGLVNVDGVPYRLMTETCTRLHPQVYELHRLGKVRTAAPARLAPWITAQPKTPPIGGPPSFDLKVGPMRIEGPQGNLACRLTLGDRLIGGLTCMAHQTCGQTFWTLANHSELTAVHREKEATVVDLTLSYQAPSQGASASEPCRFRSGWRVRIPTGRVATPFVAYECLWFENTDSRKWELTELLHWVAPCIGGDIADDLPDIPEVPNYYLIGSGWADRNVGLGIGATYPPGTQYDCHYWRDENGGMHSDLRLPVKQKLDPGERLKLSAPSTFIFGYDRKDAVSLPIAIRNVIGHTTAP